jgi:hypothetical protein
VNHVKRMRPGEWGEWWRFVPAFTPGEKDGWVVYVLGIEGCEWNGGGGGRCTCVWGRWFTYGGVVSGRGTEWVVGLRMYGCTYEMGGMGYVSGRHNPNSSMHRDGILVRSVF